MAGESNTMPTKKTDSRADMPKWAAVFDFWSNTSLPKIKNGFPSKFSENRCFACGVRYSGGLKLERAHIQPLWTGGTNEEINIHLLCHVCHKDSEDLGRPDKPQGMERYWAWFFARTEKHRMISSRLRGGDPGVFDSLEGCDIEVFVKVMRLMGEVYEHDWEMLEAIAKGNGYDQWEDVKDACENVVFV